MLATRVALAALIILGSFTAMAAQEVNLYSARKENLIKPLLDKFTKETGIKVNLLTGKADTLLQRLQSEGRNTPADLLITTDAGRLHRAVVLNLLQAYQSATIDQAVPAHLRDPDHRWIGLSQRARVIIYNKQRVKPGQLSTYEDLTNAKWKGKICIRSSGNIYNQSLLASKIAASGKEDAETWAAGMVANFSRDPKGNDRAQIKAVAAGVCDLAIANTYYLGNMIHADKDPGQQEAASKVAIFFPNQNDRGAHVNISGAGITRFAKQQGKRHPVAGISWSPMNPSAGMPNPITNTRSRPVPGSAIP